MITPKISIIIPIYNVENYLRQCLDSISCQIFTDWECILINDGSKDLSGAICEEYAQRDSRFSVIHKKNGGVSSARNIGIEKSRGDWLYFVDSDDIIKHDSLETLLSLTAFDVDMIMAGYDVVDENNKLEFQSSVDEIKNISQIATLKEMYIPTNGCYQGYLWCKLFRKSIVRENDLKFNESIYFNEDRLFIIQFLCASKKNVIFIPNSVYTYIKRKNGAMASIEKGYNPKFVTDFDAFILMKKEIMAFPEAKELLWYADQGIRTSYERNHDMMYKFHDCNTRLHWHMVKGMIKSGVMISFLKDLIRPLIMVVFPEIYCK